MPLMMLKFSSLFCPSPRNGSGRGYLLRGGSWEGQGHQQWRRQRHSGSSIKEHESGGNGGCGGRIRIRGINREVGSSSLRLLCCCCSCHCCSLGISSSSFNGRRLPAHISSILPNTVCICVSFTSHTSTYKEMYRYSTYFWGDNR